MRPFSIGIKIEDRYMEILVQEFNIGQIKHFQCTVGNSIIFWVGQDKEGKWIQIDGTTCVLAQIIGEKIQQFRERCEEAQHHSPPQSVNIHNTF